MYPHLRMAWHLLRGRFQEPLRLEDAARLRTFVGPGDIDFYPELNNGRALTLMDLGRLQLAARTGLLRAVRRRRWSFVVAGASVRFRHRLPFLSRVELSTRLLGHDGRWFYFQHVFSRRGRACFAALVRAGLRDDRGLVPVGEVLAALERPDFDPPLPDWVRAWSEADARLPWPPAGHR